MSKRRIHAMWTIYRTKPGWYWVHCGYSVHPTGHPGFAMVKPLLRYVGAAS